MRPGGSLGFDLHRRCGGPAARTVPSRSTGTAPAPTCSTSTVDAVVLTPAHQYPPGVTLAPAPAAPSSSGPARRRAGHRGRLRRRVPLRPPAGRRAAGGRPEQVVYVGTASKTLAPALRLALDGAAASGWWNRCSRPSGTPTSTPRRSDQLTLAELITLRRVRPARAALPLALPGRRDGSTLLLAAAGAPGPRHRRRGGPARAARTPAGRRTRGGRDRQRGARGTRGRGAHHIPLHTGPARRPGRAGRRVRHAPRARLRRRARHPLCGAAMRAVRVVVQPIG